MEKFRWAFIGSGMIARTVSKQILESGRHEIVSVYSRNFDNASKFAASIGAEPCRTIEQAVHRTDVDGVYICTLNSVHFDNAVPAIVAGKALLIEKPFTLSAEDAEKLFIAAKEKGVYLAEAMWTWYNPVARKVADWINSGEIGEVTEIDMSLRLNLLMFKNHKKRLLDPQTGGGALLDLGVYPLTYCYRILGYPKETDCRFKTQNGVDIAGVITLKYPQAVCRIKVAIDKLRPETATITGTKGRINIPRFHAASKAVLTAGKKEVFTGKGNYVNEFDEVAREIKAGQKFSKLVPPRATIDVMRLMEECKKSQSDS